MKQSDQNTMLKYTYLVAGVVLFSLLCMSLLFWKERMLKLDPAFIAFEIINTKSFVIAERRFGVVITQWIPLVAVHLHLPLKSILIAYSASFYLFYLSGFLLLGKWKQPKLAIALVCYHTLMVSDTFYWPNNEVHQGITFLLMFMGYFAHRLELSKGFRVSDHVVLVVLGFLSLITHPLVATAALLLWAYQVLDAKPRWIESKSIFVGYSTFILAVIALRYYWSTHTGWYDQVKMEAVTKVDFNTVLNVFNSGQATSFYGYLTTNYWLLIPLFISSIAILVYNKKLIHLLLWVGALLGYFVLICITFPETYGRDMLFYMESEWMIFGMLVILPLLLYGWKIHNPKVMLVVISVVFLIRIGYIINSYSYAHQRLQNLSTLVAQSTGIGSKTLIKPKEDMKKYLIMDWGLPIESLFLSALNKDEKHSTMKITPYNDDIRVGRDTFYSSFIFMPSNKLNMEYFNLDNSIEYQYLDSLPLLKAKAVLITSY